MPNRTPEIPADLAEGTIRFNGLRASRPNVFRTVRRTGPRRAPAPSPPPPRDPRFDSRRFKAGVVR
jgi:hypothetical protein